MAFRVSREEEGKQQDREDAQHAGQTRHANSRASRDATKRLRADVPAVRSSSLSSPRSAQFPHDLRRWRWLPMRLAPASTMSMNCAAVRMPPAAFTPILSPNHAAHQHHVSGRRARHPRSRSRSSRNPRPLPAPARRPGSSLPGSAEHVSRITFRMRAAIVRQSRQAAHFLSAPALGRPTSAPQC